MGRLFFFGCRSFLIIMFFALILDRAFASQRVEVDTLLEYEFENPNLRKEALQPRTFEFERLEFLGDRVVGLIVAQFLHNNNPAKEIGWLSEAFTTIVSKSSLAKMYEAFQLDPLILSSTCYQAPINRLIAEKTASDIIEAFLAAIYKDGGFEVAKTCMETLLNKHYPPLAQKVDIKPLSSLLHKLRLKKVQDFINRTKLSNFEEVMTYTFKNKSLLYEAFQHPSVGGQIYKKLDFIGVRVLALAIADKVFTDDMEASEGSMTLAYVQLTNNAYLKEIFQRWQLWRYLSKQHGGSLTVLLSPERVPDRMAVSSVRTFIGAVYLDGGWQDVQPIVHKLLFSAPPEDYSKPTIKELFNGWRGLSSPQEFDGTQVLPTSRALEETSVLSSKKAQATSSEKALPSSSQEFSTYASSVSSSQPLSYLQVLIQDSHSLHPNEDAPIQEEDWPILKKENSNIVEGSQNQQKSHSPTPPLDYKKALGLQNRESSMKATRQQLRKK